MDIVDNILSLRQAITSWRKQGHRIAFVPTMGNLHAGHIALVTKARSLAQHVVASIFVNPMQFGPNEDFAAYPRTFDADCQALEQVGTEILFAPRAEEIYPHSLTEMTYVEVPGLSDILCGASRPGHFRGVTTVVNKLFNIVQPDIAIFGEKDFQQLLIIRRMAQDLALPIEILGMPTIRENDGLAMSSRNRYLSATERINAALLHKTLAEVRSAVISGRTDFDQLTEEACKKLAGTCFSPDYVAIRRAEDLSPPKAHDEDLIVLAAARLGNTRLIDNLRI